MAEPGIDTLRRILRPDIADNDRTRYLQDQLDEQVDGILKALNDGEKPDGAMNGVAAFSFFCPLSKHHESAELLRYAGLAYGEWADNKLAQAAGIKGLSHEHAWSICSVVPSYVWYEAGFDAALNDKVMRAFAADAEGFRNRERSGQVGNQEMANFMADLLYAYLLSDPEYIALARQRGDAALVKTLADNGQVVEQYGPCPHYSYLSYLFAFQYAILTGSNEFDERLRNSLDWFRKYHTESLYLIPGASTRKYHLREMTRPSDIYAGLEYFTPEQPMYRKLLDRMSAKHSGSVVWQILVNRVGNVEPSEAQLEEWRQPFAELYETVYYGRGPIKYALVTRQYQTGISFTGWLPLMGLQTWAWGDEPPIIHPVHDVPSCTQSWGIDTARFPCSHLYYMNGPGCMAADVAWRPDGSAREALPDEPAFVVWRNHTLRSVAIFTDVSTVLIQTGPTGERTTRWTLNVVEPAAPMIEASGLVRFEGREGCIQALSGPPRLLEEERPVTKRAWQPQEATAVQSLLYESAGEATAYAFSDGSFTFLRNNLDTDGVLEFSDASGVYRADISTIVDERGDLTYGLDTAKIRRIGGATSSEENG